MTGTIELTETNRGFKIGGFTDRYGETCSLQESSIATEGCIWLGIDNPTLTLFETEQLGKYRQVTDKEAGAALGGFKLSASCRMHLTQDMVKALLPALQHFAETSYLPDPS